MIYLLLIDLLNWFLSCRSSRARVSGNTHSRDCISCSELNTPLVLLDKSDLFFKNKNHHSSKYTNEHQIIIIIFVLLLNIFIFTGYLFGLIFSNAKIIRSWNTRPTLIIKKHKLELKKNFFNESFKCNNCGFFFSN